MLYATGADTYVSGGVEHEVVVSSEARKQLSRSYSQCSSAKGQCNSSRPGGNIHTDRETDRHRDRQTDRLLKDSIDLLAPFLVELFNRSLSTGSVPSVFKAADITPLLKKTDMDQTDPKSYRPIANLSVLSKLLERLVARQLLDYLNSTGLLPQLQSAYRAHHSTETAVTKVLADILMALDSGDLTMLTLLDLSAASDTVDHEILLRRLEISYGLRGPVLGWFKAYLDSRTQYVRCSRTESQ